MDLYSTHIEYIKEIYSIIDRPKFVVEFGCGNYSTDWLIRNSENGVSIEMQSSDWYNSIKRKFADFTNWQFVEAIGPWNFSEFEFPEEIDFAFVDGHGDTRPECINLMMDKKCPIIVSHDTESKSYGWDRVKTGNGYKRLDFSKYCPCTSLWTINDELFDRMLKS